jgi:hypothetical protein
MDPSQLLTEASQEPPRRALDAYWETIRVLKNDKQFTFREIAEWFSQHGIEVDHNAVYRAYSKGLPPSLAAEAALEDERIEEEEWLEVPSENSPATGKFGLVKLTTKARKKARAK